MSDHESPSELTIVQAADLPLEEPGERWLVRGIWSNEAVGLIAGVPKLGKSWFGLDVAVSVASGTMCLGHFPVDKPGTVLIYLAEDKLPAVRERLSSICRSRDLKLAALPLYVVTAARLRLDTAEDQRRLRAAVARFKPAFVLLDPLVRLHACDENHAGEISALLGFFRELSREHRIALAIVHHMSKRHRAQLGQALRGSSDIHAWSDSSAYLTRWKESLHLTLEHRSAPAPEPIEIQLVLGPDNTTPHLEIRADRTILPAGPASPTASAKPLAVLEDRALDLLRRTAEPMTGAALRSCLSVNNQRLGAALTALAEKKAIRRTPSGWVLAAPGPGGEGADNGVVPSRLEVGGANG